MVKEEKKSGFFARFKQGIVSGNESSSSKDSIPPSSQEQKGNIALPETKTSVVNAEPPKPAFVPKPSSVPVNSEQVIDTVANFNFLCNSLADIGASQLKVVDMTLRMLSSSLNKIVEGVNAKG
jgi:hypothetical protein